MSQEPSPATSRRDQIIETARRLFAHYGWDNPEDLKMRANIENLRDTALSALSEIAPSQRVFLADIIDRINEFGLHPDVNEHDLLKNVPPILEDCRGVLLGLLNEAPQAASYERLKPAEHGAGPVESSVASAIARSGWVSVLEKLPESHGDVLVAHPTYSQSSAEMYGITIRTASVVRLWMSDKSDTSMHGAYWQHLPKGPA